MKDQKNMKEYENRVNVKKNTIILCKQC